MIGTFVNLPAAVSFEGKSARNDPSITGCHLEWTRSSVISLASLEVYYLRPYTARKRGLRTHSVDDSEK